MSLGGLISGVANVAAGVTDIVVGAVTGDDEQVESGVNQASGGIDQITGATNEGIDDFTEMVCDTNIDPLCTATQGVGTALQAGVELLGFGLKAVGEMVGAAGKIPWCIIGLDFECVANALRDARDGIIDNWRQLFDYTICDSIITRNVPSVKRTSSSCFSVAAAASEESAHARSLFTDIGRRYEVELRGPEGVVYIRQSDYGEMPGVFDQLHVEGARDHVSYLDTRRGKLLKVPKFDMIVASCGRFFAKEQGKDQFYFFLNDEMFLKKRHRNGSSEVVIGPPSAYFQLDPEYNTTGAQAEHLTMHCPEGHHDHPAGIRFGLYREVVRTQQLDFMVVAVKTKKWHRIESRAPLLFAGDNARPDALSAIINGVISLLKVRGVIQDARNLIWGAIRNRKLNVESVIRIAKQYQIEAMRSSGEKANPPRWAGLTTYDHISYCQTAVASFLRVKKEVRKSIAFYRVLDIGVGHVHFHEQYDRRYGGELQPILSKHPWAMNKNVNTAFYQSLNGPVRDGDGFIDGTCTYYIMVQLKREVAEQSMDDYAILIMDEQMYFSQRWRIAHPDDYKGLNFSLFKTLQDYQDIFEFEYSKYWCPFHYGHINSRSRMAVSRQVVFVNGYDPEANRHRLYSINISWATCDHSWRWRYFPGDEQAIRYLSKDDTTTGNETIQPDDTCDITVYPQTIQLREDMMVHVKGTQGSGGESVVGRWFQYYLPANNQHYPDRQGLEVEHNGNKQKPKVPAKGYEHAWSFLPEETFQKVDHYHFFGIYQRVDSRTQYYRINILSFIDISGLTMYPENIEWQCDDKLYVPTWRVKWPERADGSGNIDPIALLHLGPDCFDDNDGKCEPQTEHIRSLIDENVTLKIVYRGPLGWIAMHYEKHNDDLDTFDVLPKRIRVWREIEHQSLPMEIEIVEHVDIWQPPIVQKAGMNYERLSEQKFRVTLYFESHQPEAELAENIWRIKIGAIDENNEIELLLNVTRHDHFEKTDSEFVYEYSWVISVDEIAKYEKYCSKQGYQTFGTSIWFENVVGNVKLSDETVFPHTL